MPKQPPERIHVGASHAPEIAVTRLGVTSVYPVNAGVIEVDAADPHLSHLRTFAVEKSSGSAPGSTSAPEAPASSKE